MPKQLFYGLKRRTVEILSLDSMSGNFHILAVNYVFLVVYAILESVFVNTLLYRITPDISIVILYRGITYAVAAVSMNFAAYIGHIKSPVTVIRLGGAFYLLMYIFLFFGMERMDVFMYFTAVLAGVAAAFYWSGHNQLISHYTTMSNRDVGISILCIIQGVGTLFVPVVSGALISFSDAFFDSLTIGYRIVFGLGMAIVIAQIHFQRKLPPIEQAAHKSEFKLAIKLLFKEGSYRCAMILEILRGFRDGTFGFILNIVLFEIITSESLVGLNTFLTGIVAIAGAWVYGKLVKPMLRPRYVILSTTVMMLFCFLLTFKPSAPAIMLFSVINAFFALFVTNIVGNTVIDVITQNEQGRRCLGESIAIREIFITIGRIGGLYVLMLFPAGISGRIYAMLILTAAQYLIAPLVVICAKLIKRNQTADSR